MKGILVATIRRSHFDRFLSVLKEESPVDVTVAENGAQALEIASRNPPQAVVADQDLGDMTGAELIRRMLEIDAWIETALCSDLTEEEFHHRTEGLGISVRLTMAPDPTDALKILDLLRKENPSGQ